MKKVILTVTVNPALDDIVEVSDFKRGKEYLSQAMQFNAGGKGINVARVLDRLGARCVATGFCGGALGQVMQKLLDCEGIAHDFVAIDGNTRSNLTVIERKTNTITRILHVGPRVSRQEIKKFKAKIQKLLTHCSFVVISGRNVLGAEDGLYAQLIQMARRYRIPCFVDTHGRPLALALKVRPCCVKPNRKEAEMLLGRKLNSLHQLKKAIGYFLKRGVQHPIISLGKEGAIGSDGTSIWLAVPPEVKYPRPAALAAKRRGGQNDVGSGDSFVGGFVYSLHKGKSFVESLRMAVAAGTANALNKQTVDLRKTQIVELVEQVKMKRLN